MSNDDPGVFTCLKIEIKQGNLEWIFQCNDILDKNNRIMEMKNDDD